MECRIDCRGRGDEAPNSRALSHMGMAPKTIILDYPDADALAAKTQEEESSARAASGLCATSNPAG